MKVLVVDHDEMSTQLMRTKLQALGHEVFCETAKNNAVDRVSSEKFDVVFIDPSPLTDIRSLVLNIRRHAQNYLYIVFMGVEGSQSAAIGAGMNDFLAKPVDEAELIKKSENAERLIKLVERIGDDSEDFPSAGGVISKSAFNQLFLSSIDRADRYGERTFVLFISMSNYKEIYDLDGAYAADYAVAKLSQYLVLLRRQSDIIGQTARYEYALLLLQRAQKADEAVMAAERFTQSLFGLDDIVTTGEQPVDVCVRLIDLPVGSTIVEHIFTPGGEKKDAV